MTPKETRERFSAAVRRLLRPVVRQLITLGLTYPRLDAIIRNLYLEVAEREFALPHKKQTDSRLALLTGLSRKEVVRLRRHARPASRAIEVEDTIVTRVIGRWMGGPPYSDASGQPHPLPYDAGTSEDPSFMRLVRERGIDVPPRSVLDELLRAGIVELRRDEQLHLIRQAHIPGGDLEGKLTLLASDPGELFSTILHNVQDAAHPWLQRKVVYDNIGSDALPDLREQARQLGEDFVRGGNLLLAARDRHRNPGAPGGERSRVILAVHYFEEPRPSGENGPSVPPHEPDAPATPPGSDAATTSREGST